MKILKKTYRYFGLNFNLFVFKQNHNKLTVYNSLFQSLNLQQNITSIDVLFLLNFFETEWIFTDLGQKNFQQQNNSPGQQPNHLGDPQPRHGEFPQNYDPAAQVTLQQNVPQNNIPARNNDLNDEALYFEDLFSTSWFTIQLNNFVFIKHFLFFFQVVCFFRLKRSVF